MVIIAKCRVYVEKDRGNSIKLMIKIKGFFKKLFKAKKNKAITITIIIIRFLCKPPQSIQNAMLSFPKLKKALRYTFYLFWQLLNSFQMLPQKNHWNPGLQKNLAGCVYGWHPNILGLCDGSGNLDAFNH